MPSTQQIQTIIILNLASLIYISLSEVQVSKTATRLELFNEYMVGTIFHALLTVTEWSDSVDQKLQGTFAVIAFT